MTTRTAQWKITRLCGCAANDRGEIDYCPTHTAAPALLALLTKFAKAGTRVSIDNPLDGLCDEARALLRAVAG